MVTEVTYKNGFFTDLDTEIAERPPQSVPFQDHTGLTVTSVNSSYENRLPNGIRICGDQETVTRISALVSEYPSIWESSGFVQIHLERWMTVPLHDGWQDKVGSIKPRIYPLGLEAKKACRRHL